MNWTLYTQVEMHMLCSSMGCFAIRKKKQKFLMPLVMILEGFKLAVSSNYKRHKP